jgi:hypothetical protein
MACGDVGLCLTDDKQVLATNDQIDLMAPPSGRPWRADAAVTACGEVRRPYGLDYVD